MIIKSMSRKAPTFGQLASYIDKAADATPANVFAHNLYHDSPNAKRAAALFAENYAYLPKRRNGNALLHEVIVLEPQAHLSDRQKINALQELARRYCEIRAPHQLAWGKVHLDTDYPHLHLMLSSNEVKSAKRTRLTKAEFAKAQRDLEAFKSAEMPELVDRTVYKERPSVEPTRIKSNEGEMVRRTGQDSKKQVVKAQLSEILNRAVGHTDLEQQLTQAGFALYQRGQRFGVVVADTGKKYRLSTLGLSQDFEVARKRKPQLRPLTEVQTMKPRANVSHNPTLIAKPKKAVKAIEPQLQEQAQTKTKPNDRAARLLRDRALANERLEQAARNELKGFERDMDEDLER